MAIPSLIPQVPYIQFTYMYLQAVVVNNVIYLSISEIIGFAICYKLVDLPKKVTAQKPDSDEQSKPVRA